MRETIWKIVRAILLDRRLVLAGFLLLAVVFLDSLFLRPILSELDILEHFLFGFVLSEFTSKTINSIAPDESLSKKFGQKDSQRVDLLTRLSGFLLIGGVLWEAGERFIFPLFGFKSDPFFSFPITLTNIDGTIDVTVGAIGCFVAWYLAKSQLYHGYLRVNELSKENFLSWFSFFLYLKERSSLSKTTPHTMKVIYSNKSTQPSFS